MSGGGGKPRGGKMGTSIRATSVPAEVIGEAEIELSRLVESLKNIRQRAADAGKQYLAVEKSIPNLEMDLAKSQKEVAIFSILHLCLSCVEFSSTDMLHLLIFMID